MGRLLQSMHWRTNLWEQNRFAVAATARSPPGGQVNRVVCDTDGTVTHADVHCAGMIAACGIVTAVEPRGAITITAFEVRRERVIVESRPDDASAIILAAAILGGGGGATVALRRPLDIDVG